MKDKRKKGSGKSRIVDLGGEGDESEARELRTCAREKNNSNKNKSQNTPPTQPPKTQCTLTAARKKQRADCDENKRISEKYKVKTDKTKLNNLCK